MPADFELRRGDQLLGTLTRYDGEFVWYYCKFVPEAAFAEVKPLFDEALRVAEDPDDDLFNNAYARIEALSLRLVGLNGREDIEEFLLHIEGDEAWFRP